MGQSGLKKTKGDAHPKAAVLQLLLQAIKIKIIQTENMKLSSWFKF